MNKEQLRNEIERTRSEMLLTAEKQGLTADQTVQLSEKLDEHILLYQKKSLPK